MDQPDRRPRRVHFLRDVGVNVLANLVAALVIYLLGAALGLFPRSSEAVWIAVMGIEVVAVYMLMFAGEVGNNFYRRQLFAAGSVAVLGSVSVTYGSVLSDGDKIAWWLFVPIGLVFVVVGVGGVFHIRRGMKAAEAGQRRIRGLHWFD